MNVTDTVWLGLVSAQLLLMVSNVTLSLLMLNIVVRIERRLLEFEQGDTPAKKA